jgi:hypothetical protein
MEIENLSGHLGQDAGDTADGFEDSSQHFGPLRTLTARSGGMSLTGSTRAPASFR